ncbi:MAG: hypothetical protein EU539_06920 [Promethearchaeota archaeon]|nr:MAG: hypothetical protein EU539_06920 [Candidatus Lokiarchaeota archaeon]
MTEKLWYKLARTVIKAGNMPIPINETLIELLKAIISEDQAQFIITVFKRKPNLNIDEIKERIDIDDESLNRMLEDLMNNGVLVGLASRSTGIMVYRLLGPFPGMFEYTLMRGETGEKQVRLAHLFEELFKQMSMATQKNYDNVVKEYKNFPPINRIVPVEEEIEGDLVEQVIPYEEVSKIVDKYDDIAVVTCYCRHEKDLLNEPCKVTDQRKNCFLLGKSAQFAINHAFGTPISQEETKEILKIAEQEGLVHKAFHVHLKPELDEEAICNCCKCCCGIFSLFYKGIMPYHAITSYLANINEDKCLGCGTCVEKCPMEAIELVEMVACIDEKKCIGCGVCAFHCPEQAAALQRTGQREVYVPPPKVKY